MNHEVVVVGGGIGGLTVAALLAARGIDVALFERHSQVGGCVANVYHQGYEFEPTAGLYSGWNEGEIYQKLFAELQCTLPELQRPSPAYQVRLPDGSQIEVATDFNQFENCLSESFPECARAAVRFYRQLANVDPLSSDRRVLAVELEDCSTRFRSFVDAQLQTFIQRNHQGSSFVEAAGVLMLPHKGLWSIKGGAQSLATALANSLKSSGGVLRLDSPVLRLAFDKGGKPEGIDLLSGERATASRAIISNLTVWDTYGKLIGPSRTPRAVTKALRQATAWGAYLIFAAVDDEAGQRLSSSRILAVTDWEVRDDSRGPALFFFSMGRGMKAPANQSTATIFSLLDAQEWFGFHEDAGFHEQMDQARLASAWDQMHRLIPELGDGIEVIETATPQTFYETTRRRFGMVGRINSADWDSSLNSQTTFANVFMVGDTISEGIGLAGVAESALKLADLVTPRNQ